MAKLTHTQKVKMALRMRTHEELVQGIPLFGTRKWAIRTLQVRVRVMKRQAIARYHAGQRKAKHDRTNLHEVPQA